MFPTFCRITGHSRGLPKTNYCPLLPPISPKDAKRFISGCRITCNFNPDHHYIPITKLIEESVIKCRITEKSVYDYKYFLQPNFGDCAPSNNQYATQGKTVNGSNRNDVNNDTTTTDHFYYELDNKILVLPKSVEQELNRGVIKDVQISEDNNKIGFRYINTIKEYDLIIESTDKLPELSLVLFKGKGLKRNMRKKRKKSLLLGDLKAIFERKEQLAEIAEKQAMEKIQPDVTKVELIKSKIIHSKAPVFGYMDHNNKFTEITGEDEVPKHAVKGQKEGGVFTAGENFNEVFVPGKRLDGHRFTPGIVKDGEFVSGIYIEKEGKKKFVPGKMENGNFTAGQMIKNRDGSSLFVPGQVMTIENVKKFVPGLLIEHLEKNNELEFKFLPGHVEEVNNSLIFKAGELIETYEGLKFICEVEKDSFEIQTFDSTFDFDYDDVKAAAAVCDSLHDFARHEFTPSSTDLQEGDTRSICCPTSRCNFLECGRGPTAEFSMETGH